MAIRHDNTVMVRLSRNDGDTAAGVERAGDTDRPVENGKVVDDTAYRILGEGPVVDGGMDSSEVSRTWTTWALMAATASKY